MNGLQRSAIGVLLGLSTTTATAELLITGSGFIEIDLPGYAASSTWEYATTIPERWLPVEII
jgi:hypothetical protein